MRREEEVVARRCRGQAGAVGCNGGEAEAPED